LSKFTTACAFFLIFFYYFQLMGLVVPQILFVFLWNTKKIILVQLLLLLWQLHWVL
jgi:hypothetical protein